MQVDGLTIYHVKVRGEWGGGVRYVCVWGEAMVCACVGGGDGLTICHVEARRRGDMCTSNNVGVIVIKGHPPKR